MAVFEQLSLETQPIGLKDLLKKLSDKYSERSVRRWLARTG